MGNYKTIKVLGVKLGYWAIIAFANLYFYLHY